MAMNDNPDNKWIGKRTPRPDGADKVTGRAAYAADTTMPGMIWGKVLRSPHPHARIKSIDTSKAEKLPGVKAVMTVQGHRRFPVDKGPVMLGIQDMRWMCRNVMAREKALFHGHPVAAVAAISQAIAAEALKLIEVDYEVLPWAIDVEDAMKPGAAPLHDHIKFDGKPSNIAGTLEHKLGDVEAGFKEADVIVERSFKTEPVHQGYIEPHACLVSVVDGKATIWSSSQGQFMVRAMSALLTGMQQSDIRAIPAEIGGGFGGKTIVYLEPLALVLAQEVGPAGQDGDVARGGVPRLRPDLGLDRARSRSAPRRTARSSPARAPTGCRPAPSRARRSAAPPAAPSGPTTSRTPIRWATTSSPTAPRSRPTARRARRSAPMPSSACSTSSPRSSAWIRSSCA